MINKIALTNLGKYNEGELVFEWISLPFTDDELRVALDKIGINSNYEEYFISDYELSINYEISEYENIEALNDLFWRIDELNDSEIDDLNIILEMENNLNRALDILENGEYCIINDVNNNEDLGAGYIEEIYGGIEELPRETLEQYFDYESFGRDLGYEGFNIVNDKGITLY